MRDDDTTPGNFWGDVRQDGCDVLVGQAMEAVSLQSRLAKLSRQRHQARQLWMISMKAGVEAGHLRHIRQTIKDGLNCCEIVRLMQRGKRNEFRQILQNLTRH